MNVSVHVFVVAIHSLVERIVFPRFDIHS
jgi:hypothetical protein